MHLIGVVAKGSTEEEIQVSEARVGWGSINKILVLRRYSHKEDILTSNDNLVFCSHCRPAGPHFRVPLFGDSKVESVKHEYLPPIDSKLNTGLAYCLQEGYSLVEGASTLLSLVLAS